MKMSVEEADKQRMQDGGRGQDNQLDEQISRGGKCVLGCVYLAARTVLPSAGSQCPGTNPLDPRGT